jgi:hypothetical protein
MLLTFAITSRRDAPGSPSRAQSSSHDPVGHDLLGHTLIGHDVIVSSSAPTCCRARALRGRATLSTSRIAVTAGGRRVPIFALLNAKAAIVMGERRNGMLARAARRGRKKIRADCVIARPARPRPHSVPIVRQSRLRGRSSAPVRQRHWHRGEART